MARHPMRYALARITPEDEAVTYWTVINRQTDQLVTIHLLDWHEAFQMKQEHEQTALIRENWPDPDDPEVVALLNDETFEPEGQINVDVLRSPVYRLHMAAETIARKRAGLAPINPSNLGETNG